MIIIYSIVYSEQESGGKGHQRKLLSVEELVPLLVFLL